MLAIASGLYLSQRDTSNIVTERERWSLRCHIMVGRCVLRPP